MLLFLIKISENVKSDKRREVVDKGRVVRTPVSLRPGPERAAGTAPPLHCEIHRNQILFNILAHIVSILSENS